MAGSLCLRAPTPFTLLCTLYILPLAHLPPPSHPPRHLPHCLSHLPSLYTAQPPCAVCTDGRCLHYLALSRMARSFLVLGGVLAGSSRSRAALPGMLGGLSWATRRPFFCGARADAPLDLPHCRSVGRDRFCWCGWLVSCAGGLWAGMVWRLHPHPAFLPLFTRYATIAAHDHSFSSSPLQLHESHPHLYLVRRTRRLPVLPYSRGTWLLVCLHTLVPPRIPQKPEPPGRTSGSATFSCHSSLFKPITTCHCPYKYASYSAVAPLCLAHPA